MNYHKGWQAGKAKNNEQENSLWCHYSNRMRDTDKKIRLLALWDRDPPYAYI